MHRYHWGIAQVTTACQRGRRRASFTTLLLALTSCDSGSHQRGGSGCGEPLARPATGERDVQTSEQAHAPGRGGQTELGCEECLDRGDSWVHLRLCMTCGHVGCCDDSPNRHATRHFHATKHPVIKSFEPAERWAWCYLDEDMAESIQAFPGESPQEHYGSPSETP